MYGLYDPDLAINANNIGMILKDKGDLDGALEYAQRALKIDERVYGPEHPTVAKIANNIGSILQAKGDLDGALQYAQRALDIGEKVYDQEHPSVAIYLSNIGHILYAKGDLDRALQYTQRALKIDEKVYGPEHPDVAIDANNFGQILQSKGDLDGALPCAQRALKILQNTYGPDNPTTKAAAANLEAIKKPCANSRAYPDSRRCHIPAWRAAALMALNCSRDACKINGDHAAELGHRPHRDRNHFRVAGNMSPSPLSPPPPAGRSADTACTSTAGPSRVPMPAASPAPKLPAGSQSRRPCR